MDYTTWSKSAVQWIINKCKAVFLPINQFYDGYLGWGGRDINNDVSPIDAAMSSLHSANRAELCKGDGVTIEYSTDSGQTWEDYGLSSYEKVQLFSSDSAHPVYLGKKEGEKNNSVALRLRITMDAFAMGIYTDLKKILIEYSEYGTGGGTATFETCNVGSEDVWRTVGTYPIAGYSGWNSYRCIMGRFGKYNDRQTTNIAKIRISFAFTRVSSASSNTPYVGHIFLFGTAAWSVPSPFAKTGHLYRWSAYGDATFPGTITARAFNGHTIESNVPANAKFTDTTYSAATASKDGLMLAADKSKLDGFGQAADYAKTADVSRKQDKALRFTNISVPTSAWKTAAASSCDGVRTKYANVTLSGVTADMVPQVVFSPAHIDACNLSPLAKSFAGYIQIYAETAPTGAITIPTILCWR